MFVKCDMIEIFMAVMNAKSDDIVINFFGIDQVILYCIALYCTKSICISLY